MKERGDEWRIWFSFSKLSQPQSVGVLVLTHSQSLNTPLQVFFLVTEALGEDSMPGFPGPTRELLRIALLNKLVLRLNETHLIEQGLAGLHIPFSFSFR